ncbi:uncharacterized protein LOC142010115 [Carettochelys insculpta]|uniref:uncharacterized protein LOC142010115 n=1 Tax=Carettochelys insculpta TaxID=44489 RepID=UPI003EBD1A54
MLQSLKREKPAEHKHEPGKHPMAANPEEKKPTIFQAPHAPGEGVQRAGGRAPAGLGVRGFLNPSPLQTVISPRRCNHRRKRSPGGQEIRKGAPPAQSARAGWLCRGTIDLGAPSASVSSPFSRPSGSARSWACCCPGAGPPARGHGLQRAGQPVAGREGGGLFPPRPLHAVISAGPRGGWGWRSHVPLWGFSPARSPHAPGSASRAAGSRPSSSSPRWLGRARPQPGAAAPPGLRQQQRLLAASRAGKDRTCPALPCPAPARPRPAWVWPAAGEGAPRRRRRCRRLCAELERAGGCWRGGGCAQSAAAARSASVRAPRAAAAPYGPWNLSHQSFIMQNL